MKFDERSSLFIGIIFTLILGTLSHFFFQWSNENPFFALFSPVNESLWEHLKLLFFPVLLYTFFEILVLFKTSNGFLTSRLLSLLAGMLFTVSAFFTYTGIFGKSFFIFDISIFIISVLVTFFTSRFLEIHVPGLAFPLLANYAILLLFIILFFSFTFHPPVSPLFNNPQIPVSCHFFI